MRLTHEIESSCRFSVFLSHPLYVHGVHSYFLWDWMQAPHFSAQTFAFCRSYACMHACTSIPINFMWVSADGSQGAYRVASFIPTSSAGFSDTPLVLRCLATMPFAFKWASYCLDAEAPLNESCPEKTSTSSRKQGEACRYDIRLLTSSLLPCLPERIIKLSCSSHPAPSIPHLRSVRPSNSSSAPSSTYANRPFSPLVDPTTPPSTNSSLCNTPPIV